MRASLEEIASRSWSAIESKLKGPGALTVSIAREEGVFLGSFQRLSDDPRARFVRASGGSALLVAPDTIHVALALSTHEAFVRCEPTQILNRYVRPLLRALTKSGVVANYFGRDWISVAHRPAASVGFAHDSTTGRTSFEAFVAVNTPLWGGGKVSHLGKIPASMSELIGKTIDAERVAEAIASSYVGAFGPLPSIDATAVAPPIPSAPPWKASALEAIGAVSAGADEAGAMRVGGEWMVSADALASLEASLVDCPGSEIGQRVDAALASPSVAIFGVRSLTSIADVIARALR